MGRARTSCEAAPGTTSSTEGPVPTLSWLIAATDEIVGDDGRDFLSGSYGDDIIIGGDLLLKDHQKPRLTGRDVLLGGVGSDIIIGDDGDDAIFGFGESDFMAGRGGNDTIYGYSGNDLLDGGEGIDECKGGTGEDTAAECEIEEAVKNGRPAASPSSTEKLSQNRMGLTGRRRFRLG